MERSASFVRVRGGSRKERETGTKRLTGILQRLKIAGSYLTPSSLPCEKIRWEYKEVLHPLGKNSVTKHADYCFKA